jgi:hypothetical protein
LKEEKLKQEEKYMWAIVDGVKEKVTSTLDFLLWGFFLLGWGGGGGGGLWMFSVLSNFPTYPIMCLLMLCSVSLLVIVFEFDGVV